MNRSVDFRLWSFVIGLICAAGTACSDDGSSELESTAKALCKRQINCVPTLQGADVEECTKQWVEIFDTWKQNGTSEDCLDANLKTWACVSRATCDETKPCSSSYEDREKACAGNFYP